MNVFFNQNTDIKLLAAIYNARGEFLRWEKIGGGNLQVSCQGNNHNKPNTFSQDHCEVNIYHG